MVLTWDIHGYAIVSADDRIADKGGRSPERLSNAADWTYFQAELDKAVLCVLGRRAHEAAGNPRRRRRVVASGTVHGLKEWHDAWWWNPADLSIGEMLGELAEAGDRIAVPGGRKIFDLFRGFGFDCFHLTRNDAVRLPGGVPLFSDVLLGLSAERCLEAGGLRPGPTEVMDTEAKVTLTVWRRPTG